MSGDPRKRQWLHQCLSLAVVRGYAARIIGLYASLILYLSVLFWQWLQIHQWILKFENLFIRHGCNSNARRECTKPNAKVMLT